MSGIVINARDKLAVLRAITQTRQSTLHDCSGTLEQLFDQLHEARAEHQIRMGELKAEFDRSIAELQEQLAEAQRELKKLRQLDQLARWQPTNATLN
jgi:hypothetical protein